MGARLEVLTMLNAGTSSFDRLPGGVASTIADDVAAAMAGSSEFECELVQLIVCENPSFAQVLACSPVDPDRDGRPAHIADRLTELHFHLSDVAVNEAEKRGWKWKSRATLHRVAALALAECMGASTCSKCRGHGTESSGQVVKTCRRCSGVGNRTFSNSQRAKAVGLCEESFRRYWQGRHQVLLNYCLDSIRAVERRLTFELF